jgi:hypothetical protein
MKTKLPTHLQRRLTTPSEEPTYEHLRGLVVDLFNDGHQDSALAFTLYQLERQCRRAARADKLVSNLEREVKGLKADLEGGAS